MIVYTIEFINMLVKKTNITLLNKDIDNYFKSILIRNWLFQQ